MLEHSPDSPPLLIAAPRHLRRRRMHTEIADALLVPGAEPIPLKEPPAEAPAPAGPDDADTDPAQQEAEDPARAIQDKEAQQLARDQQYRRKRRVALVAVLFVAIAVPAIVLALLLG